LTGRRLIFSDHAVRRMFERGISVEAVVLARNAASRDDVVVTVYEPSADHWQPPDFRRRRPR
jgi:hypothetical protein